MGLSWQGGVAPNGLDLCVLLITPRSDRTVLNTKGKQEENRTSGTGDDTRKDAARKDDTQKEMTQDLGIIELILVKIHLKIACAFSRRYSIGKPFERVVKLYRRKSN